MFHHNNALTASHPYSSHPIQWPYLLRGVSFWTDNDTRQQIYFLGNPVGWWLASTLLAVFAGLLGADQISLRRGVDALDDRTRSRLYNSTGFFFLLWMAHYLPFFIMGRQLFLHHYLPAHLASALVAGALLEFVFNVEPVDPHATLADALNPKTATTLTTEGSKAKTPAAGAGAGAAGGAGAAKPAMERKRPISQRLGGQSLWASWIALVAIMAVIMYGFFFFAPLTYGKPGLTIEEVQKRKWLGYDLHFAK